MTGNRAHDATRVAVSLGARSYDIVIGSGLLARSGALVSEVLKRRRAPIVTDATVDALYGDLVQESIEAAGIETMRFVVPPGEASKSFAELERLCERLLDYGLERGDTLVALGGGVVGDLAGFAAGVLLRGIDFVQIPTTLLAQVDSSVGGKTGINTRSGKNLVGCFHQPRAVIADTGCLATLDPRDLRAGYAEIVKYALIGDRPFFDWLETNGSALLDGNTAALGHAIRVSCEAKARIVAEDERESGRRALLNLGHTFGHAIEAACGYGDAIRHGEAVAIGMALAFDLSAATGLAPADDARRVRDHLRAAGLPTDLRDPAIAPLASDPDRLTALMAKDKKASGGRLTFVLARGIGEAMLSRDVAADDLRATLAAAA